jgi:hypothetical protein
MPVLAACSSGAGGEACERAARETRRHGAVDAGNDAARLRELVCYATLAPSSHNTQCWRFRLEDRAISVLPDLARRCPVVDPDDHHLFVSLGCAAENLIQAALAAGLEGHVSFDAAAGDALRIDLEPTRAVRTPLFQAIPERQCTRGEYDGRPIDSRELKLLERTGTGEGVQVLLLTGRQVMEQVLEYIVQGSTVQVNGRAFVAELKAWIRFNGADAVRTGDGLYSGSSGNPEVPGWLGGLLFGLFFTAGSENEKYARHMRSSPGIAVFSSDTESKARWLEVGRCYERFALQATALGIRNAFLNQPVEVAALRPQLASFLGLGQRRPDLVVRFGRGPGLPPSLRRPVQDVRV